MISMLFHPQNAPLSHKRSTHLNCHQSSRSLPASLFSMIRVCLLREISPGSPASFQVHSWKQKLPLQTIMRLLQVLVPQVEKICIDKYVIASLQFAFAS